MSNPQVLTAFGNAKQVFLAKIGRPEPTDLFEKQSWSMAAVHLSLTQALLSVYTQAETIQPQDEQDFAFYALIAVSGVHHHHKTEEKDYLPILAPEFKADIIIEEHETFIAAINELQNYLFAFTGYEGVPNTSKLVRSKDTSTRPAYDGKKIAAYIESVATPMLKHLEEEITLLSSENLRSCGLPLSKLEAWARVEQGSVKDLDPFIALPFLIGHLPARCSFPALPPLFRSFFVPYVFYLKHRKAWRFIPFASQLE